MQLFLYQVTMRMTEKTKQKTRRQIMTMYVAYADDKIKALYRAEDMSLQKDPCVKAEMLNAYVEALEKLGVNVVKFKHDKIDNKMPIKFYNANKIMSLYDGELYEDISVADIASTIASYKTYLDPDDWDNWDDDNFGVECNFYIRYFDDCFDYEVGSPQFHTDHRGIWASTLVTPFDDPDQIRSIAKDLFDQMIEQMDDVCLLKLL